MKDKPEAVRSRMQVRNDKNRELGLVPISDWIPTDCKEEAKALLAGLRRRESKTLPKDLSE